MARSLPRGGQSQGERTKWWRQQSFTGRQEEGSNEAGTVVPSKPWICFNKL